MTNDEPWVVFVIDMADKSSWQVQIFGSVLIVTRHLDVTLLRRKYHVAEVGSGVGRPDRQRSHVIGFQRDPWWCLPTSRGDRTVLLLHATRQLVAPYRRLHPSLSPQAPDNKHSHQWLCWSHEVLSPLWGDRDGPLMVGTWAPSET
jgi:hypothetical protein